MCPEEGIPELKVLGLKRGGIGGLYDVGNGSSAIIG